MGTDGERNRIIKAQNVGCLETQAEAQFLFSFDPTLQGLRDLKRLSNSQSLSFPICHPQSLERRWCREHFWNLQFGGQLLGALCVLYHLRRSPGPDPSPALRHQALPAQQKAPGESGIVHKLTLSLMSALQLTG